MAIIERIDALLLAQSPEPQKKQARLRKLARLYWKSVFPEYGTVHFEQLSDDEMEARWQKQRDRQELACCQCPAKVLRVLDSPGTGDLLAWVK